MAFIPKQRDEDYVYAVPPNFREHDGSRHLNAVTGRHRHRLTHLARGLGPGAPKGTSRIGIPDGFQPMAVLL